MCKKLLVQLFHQEGERKVIVHRVGTSVYEFFVDESCEQGVAIEPFGVGADAIKICASDASAEEKFVDRIKEAPGALGINGDVAVEFAGCGEGVAFSHGNRIFEPIPVFGLVGIEDESCLAARMIAIPVGITKRLVDAMGIEAAHERLDAHGARRSIVGGPGPGGEPAAVVKLGEDCEVGDHAGAEIADGARENFRDDGVVDIDVEGGLAMHCVRPSPSKCNDTHLGGGIAI